ncbi:flagellar biosynthesis anti-sigma factor FlgM [Gallaecimonas kandeliae]|uniref:flagellar biosynthesis anti-sigma factor FlgM n=1 Tax=Gallaecimonas kandeliae TaxID=3029055 RepID=UPI0026487EF0|nr:flagellar biosynthesis anti-sigma factor FlgM [Gallaecimonas kandeliae]WKE66526.1 flagellar biosynthesis anti-sigma factor FlgM [Gallaecimonas kandeliae]
MKITPSNKGLNGLSQTQAQAPKTQAAKTAKPQGPAIHNADLANVLSGASDVDMAKVNEVRQAISQGQLALDPDKLADAILALHR